MLTTSASVRFTVWTNAMLTGACDPDTPHRDPRRRRRSSRRGLAGHRSRHPAGRAEPVARAGATQAHLALPVPGDPIGLAGPPRFNEAALETGEAVVLTGADLGLVPAYVGPAVQWSVMPAASPLPADLRRGGSRSADGVDRRGRVTGGARCRALETGGRGRADRHPPDRQRPERRLDLATDACGEGGRHRTALPGDPRRRTRGRRRRGHGAEADARRRALLDLAAAARRALVAPAIRLFAEIWTASATSSDVGRFVPP